LTDRQKTGLKIEINTEMNTYKTGLNTQKQKKTRIAAAALLAALTMAGATVSGAIMIDTVTVGDVNNTPDNTIAGYGAVGYVYQIGKYEVTNAQYAAFLNAVAATTDIYHLYNTNMGDSSYGGIRRTEREAGGGYTYTVKSDTWENKPVNFVSFWNAARFVNWLTTGDTETGVYNLNGTETPDNSSITRTLDKIPGTLWAIASEDEWYKAAYYNGDGTYRQYPVTAELSQGIANYYIDAEGQGYAKPDNAYIADVDYYDNETGANSFYGTYQQGGNMWEWTETIETDLRGVRGGGFYSGDLYLSSSGRSTSNPVTGWNSSTGFRVVALSSLMMVPEPGKYGLLAGVVMLLACVAVRRYRDARG
jgi:formylglycine-generating enzyme required for sulfatase activity